MSTKPMPPCKIEFGANAAGEGFIRVIFEGYQALKIGDYKGYWPGPEDIKELWAVVNDPKESEPLRLVKDD